MSTYSELKKNGIISPGGNRSAAEDERAKQEKKRLAAIRKEARRRAALVLQVRHVEEFTSLIEQEFRAYQNELSGGQE